MVRPKPYPFSETPLSSFGQSYFWAKIPSGKDIFRPICFSDKDTLQHQPLCHTVRRCILKYSETHARIFRSGALDALHRDKLVWFNSLSREIREIPKFHFCVVSSPKILNLRSPNFVSSPLALYLVRTTSILCVCAFCWPQHVSCETPNHPSMCGADHVPSVKN